ncbi:hypothetical protein GGF46_003713 [Coemansia sp. RSA 552]|nr:hypothetical protein GGF46_003713 [Coemansia sp. RSA 552]
MLDLQTTTDPSAHYPTCVQNLRSRVQSSPWTQQLTSGLRRNTLSKWQVPRAHLLRIKAKQYQSTDILAIDELEYYSEDLRWNTLHSESTQPPNPELLDSSRPWKAFVMSGRPAVYTAPTLGMRALEGIYHMLPRLTPACMRIPTLPFGQSPKRGKKNMQKLANAFAHSQEEQPAGEQMVRSLSSQIDIRYRCGTETFVKSVPAYHAEAIFGPSVCAEVLPSLLHAPLPDENSAGSGWRYLGVVALPCTANLATQLHRLCEYAEDI